MEIYNLPDLTKYNSKQEWETQRPQLLNTVMNIEYGVRPSVSFNTSFKLLDAEEGAANGLATRKTIEVCVKTDFGKWKYPVYLWDPSLSQSKPLVLFLSVRKRKPMPMTFPDGMSIEAMMADMAKMVRNPERSMPKGMPEKAEPFYMDKDIDSEYWPVRECLQHGIAMAGVYIDDVELDDPNVFPSGLATVFTDFRERKQNEWGAIAIWAFGASRALDCICEYGNFESNHISIAGHSRAGKAAIVAAINDTRFSHTISIQSGCCGSAISRQKEGESVMSIQYSFPHWFAPGFKKYESNEDALPYDQHSVLALLAPRKLYVTSASEDCWSGPAWEYEGVRNAACIWELYGEKSVFTEHMPETNIQISQQSLAYHMREGNHAVRSFDWQQFIPFIMS